MSSISSSSSSSFSASSYNPTLGFSTIRYPDGSIVLDIPDDQSDTDPFTIDLAGEGGLKEVDSEKNKIFQRAISILMRANLSKVSGEYRKMIEEIQKATDANNQIFSAEHARQLRHAWTIGKLSKEPYIQHLINFKHLEVDDKEDVGIDSGEDGLIPTEEERNLNLRRSIERSIRGPVRPVLHIPKGAGKMEGISPEPPTDEYSTSTSTAPAPTPTTCSSATSTSTSPTLLVPTSTPTPTTTGSPVTSTSIPTKYFIADYGSPADQPIEAPDPEDDEKEIDNPYTDEEFEQLRQAMIIGQGYSDPRVEINAHGMAELKSPPPLPPS